MPDDKPLPDSHQARLSELQDLLATQNEQLGERLARVTECLKALEDAMARSLPEQVAEQSQRLSLDSSKLHLALREAAADRHLYVARLGKVVSLIESRGASQDKARSVEHLPAGTDS